MESAALIEEGFFADINGAAHWLTLRGRDRRNPALMILSGPGVAMSRLAPFFAPWEAHFTLVQWDQPGAGATFARNGPLPLSFDGLTRDAFAVAAHALDRLDHDSLVLLGISGGSMIGLTMARRRPDLVTAYVGTGQFVDWGAQLALGYAAALARARAAGDAEAVNALEKVGPPPYADLASDMAASMYVGAQTPAERVALTGLDGATLTAMGAPPAGATYVPEGLAAPNQQERALAAYAALRPEIVSFDARELGGRFRTPMIFLQGDADIYSVTSEVEAYAAEIEAPSKALRLIEGGGHSAFFLRDSFLAALREELALITTARSGV
jgi:proline iminopeptidase